MTEDANDKLEAIATIKKLIEGLENDKLNIREKTREIEDEINSLHKNTRFFKAILAAALALDKTIELTLDKTTELTKSENQRIPLFSLADIITGIVINFEKEGFIKIVKEEK